MSTYPALPPHGWQRLTLELSDDTIAALEKEARGREYDMVFKKVGGEIEDPNRRQSRLPEDIEKLSAEMKILHQQVIYAVRSRDSLYVPRTYSFMHSKPGGVEQEPHQDYTPDAIIKVTKQYTGTIPCSLIVALMTGTRLKVFAGCFDTVDWAKAKVLELRPGDAVLFRADLIHCGMSYSVDNYRLHCYGTVPGPMFEPDIVAGVNEKVYSCKYCAQEAATSNAVRQHRFYCAKNPRGHKKAEKGRRMCSQCGKWFESPGGLRTHRFRKPDCISTGDKA